VGTSLDSSKLVSILRSLPENEYKFGNSLYEVQFTHKVFPKDEPWG